MIIDVSSFSAALGKLGLAMDFNKRLCEYHNKQDLVLRSYGIHPVNGQREKVITVLEFDSLATMEQYYKEFWQNGWPKFQEEWDWNFAIEGSFDRYQYQVQE